MFVIVKVIITNRTRPSCENISHDIKGFQQDRARIMA
jgi:hypothetical protein